MGDVRCNICRVGGDSNFFLLYQWKPAGECGFAEWLCVVCHKWAKQQAVDPVVLVLEPKDYRLACTLQGIQP